MNVCVWCGYMCSVDDVGVCVVCGGGGGLLCVYGWCGLMVFVGGCVGGVVFVVVWVWVYGLCR